MSFFSQFTQNVQVSSTNSSTSNLAKSPDSGYQFLGTSASTLGVAGIQVTLYTTQNCIVTIEQSPDTTPHWDTVWSYYYTASSKNFSRTVHAVSSYVRVTVTNLSATTATTEFRLQTALCPIVEPLPDTTDVNGRLQVSSSKDEYGFEAENTPMGDQRFVEPVRLVGTSFEGTTIDSNFWTTVATGTAAAIAQASASLTLTSGTANAATVTAFTVRRARYLGGSPMRYRSVIQLGDTGTANNTRRWGVAWGSSAMPTVTDGAWFQVSGTTFSIVTMKAGTPTTVTSFNGQLGASYALTTNVATYEIYWTNSKVYFTVGGSLLHTVSASTSTWADTMSFHAFMDSVNSNTLGASVTMTVRTATIYRLGKIDTAPIWKHLTAATGTVLKYGAGRLHRIVFNTFGNGATVTLYDALTATNPICITAPPNNIYPGSIDYELDFYVGLTITITGTVDLTVIYE